MKRPLVVLLAASVLLLAACATTDPSSAPVGQSSSASMGGMGAGGFGEPGDVSSVDRTIGVRLDDSLAVEPSSLHATVGETIRFRVTNAGAAAHEFVLGDAATQQEHEMAMGTGNSMQMGESNVLALRPGQTKVLVWSFTDPGTVQFACHVPGHYTGGMVGTIMVM